MYKYATLKMFNIYMVVKQKKYHWFNILIKYTDIKICVAKASGGYTCCITVQINTGSMIHIAVAANHGGHLMYILNW